MLNACGSADKEKYVTYKLQCNSFFMDLVMRFCFADGQPPDVEVMNCEQLTFLSACEQVVESS